MIHTNIRDYTRSLDLKTGVLTCSFVWATPHHTVVEIFMERFACYHQPHLFAQCVLWRVQSGMEQIHFDASMDYDVTQNGFRHYHVEQMRKEPDGQTSEMVTDNDFSVRISTTETLLNDGESHAFTRITAISTSRDGEKDWRRATSALLQSPENKTIFLSKQSPAKME